MTRAAAGSPLVTKLIDAWMTSMRNQGRSPNTLRAYRDDVTDTMRRIAANRGVELGQLRADDITVDDIETAQAQWRAEPDARFGPKPERRTSTNPRPKKKQATGRDADLRSNATAARRISALRRLFAWAYERNRVSTNPTLTLKAPKPGKKVTRTLHAEDATRLAAGDATSAARWPERDTLIVLLGAACGLRLAEITNLTLGGLRGNPPTEIIFVGKGGDERIVPIPPIVAAAIVAYLPTRDAHLARVGLQSDTLIVSSRPRPTGKNQLTVSNARATVAYAVDRALTRLGAREHGVNVHKLRHTFATLGLTSGALNLRQVQELLGHASLLTTQRYTFVSDEEKAAGMRIHPLANPPKR